MTSTEHECLISKEQHPMTLIANDKWITEGQFELWLEAFIDKYGVPNVLYKVAYICLEKATHLEENWQDEAAAKIWHGTSHLIDELADRLKGDHS